MTSDDEIPVVRWHAVRDWYADGETMAVVLSPAAYDKLAGKAELARSFAMLERSVEDINAGRTQPAKKAIDEIATEFGLRLKRKPTPR